MRDDDTRLLRRVADLEEQLEAAKLRLRDLEIAFKGYQPPLVLKMTRYEGRILGLLLTRDVVSRDNIMAALYENYSRPDVPAPKTIDVFMTHVRKKLVPIGVSVQTIWGFGWALERKDKDIIQALEAPMATVAA